MMVISYSAWASQIFPRLTHTTVAGALMDMYQNTGDAVALQYGGSAAYNIVFLERYGRETLTLGAKF